MKTTEESTGMKITEGSTGMKITEESTGSESVKDTPQETAVAQMPAVEADGGAPPAERPARAARAGGDGDKRSERDPAPNDGKSSDGAPSSGETSVATQTDTATNAPRGDRGETDASAGPSGGAEAKAPHAEGGPDTSAAPEPRPSGGETSAPSPGAGETAAATPTSGDRPAATTQGDQQPRQQQQRGGGRDRGRRDRGRRGGGGGGGTGGGGGGETAEREPRERRPESPPVDKVGILDVLPDGFGFLRTQGFVQSDDDVYVSLSQIRRFGLRRGDEIAGQVREPKDNEKYNALLKVDTVNGVDPDTARQRPLFDKLTPLFPEERLRLETPEHDTAARIIDLICPIGKGQRGLIVSPPKAGKTTILQEDRQRDHHEQSRGHLMVVLVDERPEEVTDMQRTVKGEVDPLDLRPARPTTTTRSPSWPSSGPSGWSRWATTSSCCSTRSPGLAAPTTWRAGQRHASCPAASTPPRCTRPSGSSARPATSRTAAR